jgi:hypothetical protein
LECGRVARLDVVSDGSTREGVFFRALPRIFLLILIAFILDYTKGVELVDSVLDVVRLHS